MKKILIRAACVVALASSSAPARTTTDRDASQVAATYEASVDVSEQASVNVRFGPAAAAPGAEAAAATLPAEFQQYITDTQVIDGNIYVTLTYPAGQDEAIKARLESGLAGREAPLLPGPAASPAAGLFAFGFMPAMPVLSNFMHPDGSVRRYPPGAPEKIETNFCRDKQPQAAPVSRPAHSAVPGQTITFAEIAE